MAWETRAGRRYYYRKRRDGGRVVSEYIGSGPGAEAMATLDDYARLRALQERETWREEVERQRDIDRALDEAGDLVRLLTYATLLANGYHTHKGQWRKKR